MTSATLSFALPGRVMFDCDAIRIHQRRDLEDPPPFSEWSAAYAAGYWSAEALLAIGLAIGRWFDGRQQWLSKLRTAPGPVILNIQTTGASSAAERAALDAPWELLAYLEPGLGNRRSSDSGTAADQPDALARLLERLGPVDLTHAHHLVHDPTMTLSPVRRIGLPAQPASPSSFRLSVVFMPAQPEGLNQLKADLEEAAIHRAIHGVGVDLAVEESGTLAGLADMVARVGDCDVIQLSCHGVGGADPRLALEDEIGKRLDATANDLSNGFGTLPRLLFLSACSTAASAGTDLANSERTANVLDATVGSQVVWPLASDLCRRGWPAVLGWSILVSNSSAIDVAVGLYRQIALKATLEEALTKIRTGPAWHKLRLFVGPAGGGRLVNSTRPRPDQPDFVRSPQFLDPATRMIPVAAPEIPFPHRRQLQRVMVTMRDGNYNGVIVHGGDALARATFAGRVLRRGDRDRLRVVVADELDAMAILQQIRVQTARREIDKIVADSAQAVTDDPANLLSALRSIVEGPGRTAGSGAFTLVLHGFDPIAVTAAPSGRRSLDPLRLEVARALIRAFAGAGTASRLLFTSAAPFSVVDIDGRELADSLLAESLDQL